MNVLLAIPARYGSSRFEGKPLANIMGKTMIQRVVEQCLKVQDISNDTIDVMVATDDERIYNHVKTFGNVVMTSSKHESGTDRVAEVVEKASKEYDIVINVQGDEPLIHPEQIVQLTGCFNSPDTKIATLIQPVVFSEELRSPDIIKCIVNHNFKAIYFSRHLIPYYRGVNDLKGKEFYKHIGMYGFTPGTLKAVTRLPQSFLEKAECLEQLRWLENGFEIQTAVTRFENIAVDSPADIDKVIARIELMNKNHVPGS